MSRMIPTETVDSVRRQVDISIDLFGIPCRLFLIQDMEKREALDVYSERPANFAPPVETTVFIDWAPSIWKLRKFGIYVEDQVPILAWFKWRTGLSRHSYFEIDVRYVPDNITTTRFELIVPVMKGLHDQEIVTGWQVAPYRRTEA